MNRLHSGRAIERTAIQILPWVSLEQRQHIRLRSRIACFQLSLDEEGLSVPDEPCISCTIVQWLGTPQCVEPIYQLTGQLRLAWGELAKTYNEKNPDFPLRTLDCAVILAMFIAGEIEHFPLSVLNHDCADIAEYFCRYVRLIQHQTAYERSKEESTWQPSSQPL